MAKLVLRSGPQAGAEYPLKDALITLGRRSQCDVPVVDAKSSREHALIHDQGGALFLQDLSRNGTLLNDAPALKTEPGSPLKFGDHIRIGDTTYELVDEKSEPISIDIPGYNIIEKAGSGGMGTVFKARQLSMDRIVALKILNERYSSNAEFVDRFIREARAAGKLNHPNVIHVHDISRAAGRHFFSMEFIDGPSIRELLKKEKRIPVGKALDIILQAAKALEFAHENRIVHRDIKPDNIMLTKEGIVKLADLGIAKTFEESSAQPSKEQRGVFGTPHYMAPEQALGKALDHRADIYSLGATFYHMVTGHTPFSGATVRDILKAHVQSSLAPIQELNKDVPEPVCFIIERMMAKLPEKRYPNMARLIEDIERVQSGKVRGIERIDAGDSSVLRAVKAPTATRTPVQGRAARAAKAKEPGATLEIATGVQIPVRKIVNAAILLLVLLVALCGIFILPKYIGAHPAEIPEKKEEKKRPPLASTPESHALMLEARHAWNENDLPHVEKMLLQIRRNFTETLEGDEAIGMLAELEKKKSELAKQKALALLDEAARYERENAGNSAEILAKYKATLAASGDQPAVFAAAKLKIEQLEKSAPVISPVPQPAPIVNQVLFEKANQHMNSGDFDGARQMLKEFMYSTQNAEEGSEARKQLVKLEETAKARIKDLKDRTASMEPLAAAMEWSKYTSGVKDSVNAAETKPILDEIEEKTQTEAMDELSKAGAFAKDYKFAEAGEAAEAVEKKWAGLKWAALAKAKQLAYKRQKELYENFFKLLKEKIAAGPVTLPFPLETKIKSAKNWAAVDVRDDVIVLDAIPARSAPGTSVKVTELQPKDQYLMMLVALPKEPTAEQNLQLSAFCAERGLPDEADKHEKKKAAELAKAAEPKEPVP